MKMADAKQKRNEQLKRWIGSETDLEPPVVKRKKTKVKFDDGAVFLAACSSGDTEEVLRLLERGADINYANVDGLTALHQVGAGPSEGSWPHWGGGRRARPAEFPPPPPEEEVEEEGAGGGGAPSAGGCRGGERRGQPGSGRGSARAEGPLTLLGFPLGARGAGPAPRGLRGPGTGVLGAGGWAQVRGAGSPRGRPRRRPCPGSRWLFPASLGSPVPLELSRLKPARVCGETDHLFLPGF